MSNDKTDRLLLLIFSLPTWLYRLKNFSAIEANVKGSGNKNRAKPQKYFKGSVN